MRNTVPVTVRTGDLGRHLMSDLGLANSGLQPQHSAGPACHQKSQMQECFSIAFPSRYGTVPMQTTGPSGLPSGVFVDPGPGPALVYRWARRERVGPEFVCKEDDACVRGDRTTLGARRVRHCLRHADRHAVLRVLRRIRLCARFMAWNFQLLCATRAGEDTRFGIAYAQIGTRLCVRTYKTDQCRPQHLNRRYPLPAPCPVLRAPHQPRRG